jgi:ribonuclease D
MHGADYDLRLLKKKGNFVPDRLFDTMLAARFLGLRQFSLSQLVECFLGVKLEKSSQKANWSRRPLTERMIAYAINDTQYLLALHEILSNKLESQGRLIWHKEACRKLVLDCSKAPSKKTNDAWRIKGSESLSPKALTLLRELWHWRETEAVRTNKPPYFVMSHEMLIQIAKLSSHSTKHIKSFSEHFPVGKREKILKIIKVAMDKADEVPFKPHRIKKRFSQSAQKRFRELTLIRDTVAEKLGLEPSFIAGRGLLIALAEGGNHPDPELMNWQRELLKIDGSC